MFSKRDANLDLRRSEVSLIKYVERKHVSAFTFRAVSKDCM